MLMTLFVRSSYAGVSLCMCVLLYIMYSSVVANHICSPILAMMVMANMSDPMAQMITMFIPMFMVAQIISVCFVCVCATNMGMYVCSDSSVITVPACMASFGMYSGVIVETAMNSGI